MRMASTLERAALRGCPVPEMVDADRAHGSRLLTGPTGRNPAVNAREVVVNDSTPYPVRPAGISEVAAMNPATLAGADDSASTTSLTPIVCYSGQRFNSDTPNEKTPATDSVHFRPIGLQTPFCLLGDYRPINPKALLQTRFESDNSINCKIDA